MPKFNYVIKTKDSRTVRETVAAASKAELIAKLRASGVYILSIKEEGESKSSGHRVKKSKRNSVKLYDLTFFARNLATTLYAGVTLLRSLELLASQTESLKFEKILKDCSKNVKEGLSLGEAIGKYPKVFSALWQGIIETGESSGNLPFVLEKLADYLEMRMDFQRKVVSALVYPVILIIASVGAIFAFLYFILPQFITLFESFKMELPGPTKALFAMSMFLRNYIILIVFGVIGFGFGFREYTKNAATKPTWDKLKLKIPLMGELTMMGCLERFTSTVFILLDSGLPVVYTLDVAARSVGNSLIEKNILTVREKVREGASLSNELSKAEIFPVLIAEMSRIGEETGSLPQVYNKIATYYQKEVSTRLERLMAAFEPIMILFVGLIIGGMVIALFMPIFALSTMGTGG